MADESNLSELNKTIALLQSTKKLEDVDAAEIQMLRSLAAAVDSRPHSPGLWQQYREALGGLRADDDGDGETIEALLGRLSSDARDPQEG